VMSEPLVQTSKQRPPKTWFLVGAITVGLITLSAAWTGVHLSHTRTNVQQTAPATPQAPPAISPPVISPPTAVENPQSSIAAPLPTVVHQEIPDISRRARESIRGVIKIAVRVMIDPSGNVVAATLDTRTSSKHLARAALEAAKKWQFSQAADDASRAWLLHFEFSREGTTAQAAASP
jgi:TonB family protein